MSERRGLCERGRTRHTAIKTYRDRHTAVKTYRDRYTAVKTYRDRHTAVKTYRDRRIQRLRHTITQRQLDKEIVYLLINNHL